VRYKHQIALFLLISLYGMKYVKEHRYILL
jgi:hypothetical protein